MRHPADHDPDRHYYVLFVEGKGYITNYSMWASKKEYLQYDERVERASFWDCAEAVPTTPGAKTHYVRRNNKGIEDLDKNVTLAQETPAAYSLGYVEGLINTWWRNIVVQAYRTVHPCPQYGIIETPGLLDINFRGQISRQGCESLEIFLRAEMPAGVRVVVS